MEHIDNIKTALDAGAAIGQNTRIVDADPGFTPFIVVPEGYSVENLEKLLPAPARKRASVTMTDAASFVSYTKKHGSLDECVIYANVDADTNKCNLLAIINDDKADSPQWRDHKCLFSPKLSLEWTRWLGSNKKTMKQSEFATWLEDNLGDIASVPNMPSGADILAMALGFEANADKKFRSKINLQNGGVSFEFVEDETKETRTRMVVFERFTLGLPVFDGGTIGYVIEARLKYREKEGSVTFWYELIRPDRVFKDAVADTLNQIKEQTGFMLLHGSA
jgi:uncharacterized protein YfdQ (DUF2303 family)